MDATTGDAGDKGVGQAGALSSPAAASATTHLLMSLSPSNIYSNLGSPASHLGDRMLSAYLENSSSLDGVLLCNSNSCSSLPEGLFDNKPRLIGEDSIDDYLFTLKTSGVVREKLSDSSLNRDLPSPSKSIRLTPLEADNFDCSNLSLFTDSNQQLLSTALSNDDDDHNGDDDGSSKTKFTSSSTALASAAATSTASVTTSSTTTPSADAVSHSKSPRLSMPSSSVTIETGSSPLLPLVPAPPLHAAAAIAGPDPKTRVHDATIKTVVTMTASTSQQDSAAAQMMPKLVVNEEIRPMNPCTCKRSKCLKLYCDCFAMGVYCQGCTCVACNNLPAFEAAREEARKSALENNPKALNNKLARRSRGASKAVQNVGCHCKKSGCIKRYCECFEAGHMCNEMCKCLECKNFEGSIDLQALSSDSTTSTRSGRGERNRAPMKGNTPLPTATAGSTNTTLWTPASSSSSQVNTVQGEGEEGSTRAARRQVTHLPVFGPGKQSVTKLAALNVFAFLSNEDLYNSMLVCSLWESVALDDALWDQPN